MFLALIHAFWHSTSMHTIWNFKSEISHLKRAFVLVPIDFLFILSQLSEQAIAAFMLYLFNAV